jgi:hypothetical protein
MNTKNKVMKHQTLYLKYDESGFGLMFLGIQFLCGEMYATL